MTDRTTRAKRALELAERATEGPWVVDTGHHFGPLYCVYVPDTQEVLCTINEWSPDVDKRDACFIADSRTLLPALARDVIELEAECDQLRAEIARLREALEQLPRWIRDEKIDSYGRSGDSFNDGIEMAAVVAESKVK